MSFQDIPLSKEDFAQSKWEDVISQCDKRVCCKYSQLFWNKSRDAEASGNRKNQAVFTLLAVITFPELKPESNDKPFGCMDAINSISDGYLDALRDWVQEISDFELKARVTDVLSIRKRNQKTDFLMAQLAIESYLKSAQVLEDPEHWRLGFNRITRAIHLAKKINYKFLEVVAHIESILDKYNGEDPLFLSAKLMELLQEYQQGDASKYAALAGKLATRAEAEHDWDKARTYLEVKTRWHLLEKDYDTERITWISLAETYVKESENAIKLTPPRYMLASYFLQKAIEAFRKTKGAKEEIISAKERAKELHKILLEYQQEALKEMVYFSNSVDISQEVKLATSSVKKQTFQEAVFSLALLGSSPKVDYLRQEVQELGKNYFLQTLFPTMLTNEMGKVIARQPSMMSDNPQEVEKAILCEMYRNARFQQLRHGIALVQPAIYQINLDHQIQINDFLPIVLNSPFVPHGREYIYAQGLHAGLTGDFLVAAHLLIPQIENSIRYLLRKQRVVTSGLDDQGIQDERNLNTTLYLSEIISILGEDTVFDLKGLLVERFGSNLRNRMAHGLINQNEFFQPELVYLWWLTLRLCCVSLINEIHENQDETTQALEDSESDTSYE